MTSKNSSRCGRLISVVAAMVLLGGPVGLLNAAPDDFARGRVLDPVDDSVVQRVRLPDDLYQWVSRADLGDVRVFNDSGDEVPYALRRPQTENEYAPWQTVPLFRLPVPGPAGGNAARVAVQVNGVGTIAIRGASSATSTGGSGGFLVDMDGLTQPPTELQLDWKTRGSDEFMGKFRIETSDDLDRWQTIVSSTTIARLSGDDHEVRVDRIALPARSSRYLRITQLSGVEKLALSGVQVRHRQSQLPQRRWLQLQGEATDGGYEFHTGGRFPIDRITVEDVGVDGNYLVAAELISRADPDQEWRRRGRHTFYRTTINGTVAESTPLAISHRDQYWRLTFDERALADPQLRIGWLPDELLFLKQGGAPYVLAYGQAGLEGRQWPLGQLLRQLGEASELAALAKVPAVAVGAAAMLGGPARLQPPPEPIDWQTIVLWSVLLLGVLVVGYFALRLLRA